MPPRSAPSPDVPTYDLTTPELRLVPPALHQREAPSPLLAAIREYLERAPK